MVSELPATVAVAVLTTGVGVGVGAGVFAAWLPDEPPQAASSSVEATNSRSEERLVIDPSSHDESRSSEPASPIERTYGSELHVQRRSERDRGPYPALTSGSNCRRY